MTRKRRPLAAASALTIVAAACGGTGGGDAPSPGGEISGSISFMTFGEPEELNAYRALIDAFEEAEPDVTVRLIEASDREDLLARRDRVERGSCSSCPMPPETTLAA